MSDYNKLTIDSHASEGSFVRTLQGATGTGFQREPMSIRIGGPRPRPSNKSSRTRRLLLITVRIFSLKSRTFSAPMRVTIFTSSWQTVASFARLTMLLSSSAPAWALRPRRSCVR